ncbi:MAG TPA: sialidase family protein [Prosthecobacter sp.]|nr:sialidase family protein [Prosthecobacter sp.]
MLTTACTALVLSFLTMGALAAEPLFETQCLFALTPNNRPNYRIPSIITAPNGDVLIICEKRNDGPGDIGNHDIVMKRSADQGRAWSGEIVILDDENRVCTDITVGLDRETKKLWLFFLRDKKQYAHLTSMDNGLSWQGPVIIHDQVIQPEWQTLKGRGDVDEPAGNPKSHAVQWEKGWVQRYGCGPGNAMVQLKSGRLLVPARHREDTGKGRLRSFAHCFFSDDHGASWKLGGTIGMNTSECQFIELNDGSVRVISRNESSEDSPTISAISRRSAKTAE